MRFYRRSRLRSSRGHVRLEQGPPWGQWALWGGSVLAGLVVLLIVVTQVVLPLFEDEATTYSNRTWLEYAWTTTPPNAEAARQLAQRLAENEIERVYLEASAWRADGTLLEGEYAADFVRGLREAAPDLTILVWLRMTGEDVADADRRAEVVALAQKAVRQWGMDGAQLNAVAIANGSETYVQLLRDLRAAIGADAVFSVTVPPDRIPADPDVPIGATGDPDLTWDLHYKQRVALLGVDEVVVMAHASGLHDPADYERWMAYQVESYAEILGELEHPPQIVIAVPTYEEAPEHDPAVENVTAALAGVRDGIEGAGEQRALIVGVGLLEYKTTDSLEWALYAEHWLGRKP